MTAVRAGGPDALTRRLLDIGTCEGTLCIAFATRTKNDARATSLCATEDMDDHVAEVRARIQTMEAADGDATGKVDRDKEE